MLQRSIICAGDAESQSETENIVVLLSEQFSLTYIIPNNIFLLSFLLQHGYSFSSRWKIRKQKSTELLSKYSQHKQKELLRYDDYALSEMHFWRISENVRFSQSFRKKWKTAIVSRYWMTNMLHPALDFLFLYFSVAFRKSPCFYFSYWFKLKMKLKFIIVIKRLQYSNVYLDPG